MLSLQAEGKEKSSRSRSARRVLLVVDAQNLRHPTVRPDYAQLLQIYEKVGELAASVAFVTDTPETVNFQLMLRYNGYEVKPVRPLTNGNGEAKCNADLAIAFWLGRAVEQYRMKRGDVVVLCTGDADFTSIVEWLRARDITVVIIGYKACTSHHMQIAATQFHAIEETPGLQYKYAT